MIDEGDMKEMEKRKLTKQMKNIRSLTVLFFVITVIIWFLMLLVKIYFFEFSIKELFDDVVSNILAILLPIIIFNFTYEYYTQKYKSDEISEKIADTIMGRTDIMCRFKEEQKIDFIRSTINTMVNPEAVEMAGAIIYPYITNGYNIRTYYKYSITLRDYIGSSTFPSEEYIKVYENLRFTKKYINHEKLDQSYKIAFFIANHKLDTALRNQEYIFQENLTVADKEFKQIRGMNDENLSRLIKEEMQLVVYIDNQKAEIINPKTNESGIYVEVQTNHITKNINNSAGGNTRNRLDCKDEHSIEISFAMPQIKEHSEILVSINEPTYAPIIQLSYPEATMKVKAYSFLNDGDETSVERATHTVGTYEFCIQNKWIYPVSGVVFVINSLTQSGKEKVVLQSPKTHVSSEAATE